MMWLRRTVLSTEALTLAVWFAYFLNASSVGMNNVTPGQLLRRGKMPAKVAAWWNKVRLCAAAASSSVPGMLRTELMMCNVRLPSVVELETVTFVL